MVSSLGEGLGGGVQYAHDRLGRLYKELENAQKQGLDYAAYLNQSKKAQWEKSIQLSVANDDIFCAKAQLDKVSRELKQHDQ